MTAPSARQPGRARRPEPGASAAPGHRPARAAAPGVGGGAEPSALPVGCDGGHAPERRAPAKWRLQCHVSGLLQRTQEKQSCCPPASITAETRQRATGPSGRDGETLGDISRTGRCSAVCAGGQYMQLGQGTSGVIPAGSDSMGSAMGRPGGRSPCLVTTGRVVRDGRCVGGEAGLGYT